MALRRKFVILEVATNAPNSVLKRAKDRYLIKGLNPKYDFEVVQVDVNAAMVTRRRRTRRTK